MRKLVILMIVMAIVTVGGTVYAAESTSAPTVTTVPYTTVGITTVATMITEDPQAPVEQTWAEWLIETVVDNLFLIVSSLALVASSIVAWLNKHKMFPALAEFFKKALALLLGQKDELTKWSDEVKKALEDGEKRMANATEEQKVAMKEYTAMLDTALQKINGLAEALAEDAKARDIVIQSLNDQEDVLHTIVQSSDMAKFKKTDAEEKHLAHIAAIKDLRAGKKPEEGGEDA